MTQARWRHIRTTCVAGALLAGAGCGAETELPVPRVLSAAHERPTGVTYSPDGSRVAYLTEGSEGLALYVANADLSDPVLLSTGLMQTNPLPWSPDGREVAVVRAANLDIWTVPVDGGAPRQITNAPGFEAALQYHPDGDRLMSIFFQDGIHAREIDLATLTSRAITLNGESGLVLWSPDASKSLYALIDPEPTLWVADGGGGGARQLTRPQDRPGLGGWSPDGRYVAYTSRRTGWSDVWIVAVESGEARQLTRDVRADYEPQWSPDGRWIAFLSDRGRQTDVWLVSVESGAEIRVTDNADVETNLQWRPGSTELTYELETQREAIWALSLPDRSERRLTPDATGLDGARLSPTGGEVVYELARGGGAVDLMVVPTMGGDARALVADGNDNSEPAWSPDGSQIAFVSNRAGSADIWLVDALRGEARRITDDPGSETLPRWSDDGSVIYYRSNRDAQIGNVWSVSPMGGESNQVTTDGNVGGFSTIPGRADLLLGVLDAASGSISASVLAPDGAIRSVWSRGNTFIDRNQPGGDWVAMNQPGGDGNSNWLVSLTSGEERQILGGADGTNDWSPDGRRLVYRMGRMPSDLAILTLADSTVQRLTDTPDLHEDQAEWSADGQIITFVRGRGTRAIMTVDVARLIAAR